MAAPAWAQLQEPSARAAAGEKGGSFRVDPMSRHRCRIELMTRIQVQGRCLLVDHIMSAKTKVTKTKTAALTGKQETYNLSDLHCGFVELELGESAASVEIAVNQLASEHHRLQ